MTIIDIIKTARKERNMPTALLCEKLGYNSKATVSQILSRPDIRMSTALKLLNAMDYDIIVRSRLADKTEYKVDVEKK